MVYVAVPLIHLRNIINLLLSLFVYRFSSQQFCEIFGNMKDLAIVMSFHRYCNEIAMRVYKENPIMCIDYKLYRPKPIVKGREEHIS